VLSESGFWVTVCATRPWLAAAANHSYPGAAASDSHDPDDSALTSDYSVDVLLEGICHAEAD
jgi:hypothetical protein